MVLNIGIPWLCEHSALKLAVCDFMQFEVYMLLDISKLAKGIIW